MVVGRGGGLCSGALRSIYPLIFVVAMPGLLKSAYATHNFLCGRVFLTSGWKSGSSFRRLFVRVTFFFFPVYFFVTGVSWVW